MEKIDIESLDAADMLRLLREHKIDIVHVDAGNYCAAINYQEGSTLIGRSHNTVIEAIKLWAHNYNRLVEATETLDKERQEND